MTLYLLVVMHTDDLYLHVCGKKSFDNNFWIR